MIDNFDVKNWERILIEIKPTIKKAIYKYIYQVDSDTVKEIEQEVLIKIFNKISLFERERSFNDWVYIVTVNHVLDYLRKKKRNTFIGIDSGFQITENENSSSKISITQLLNTLPQEYRNLLIKKYIYGFKQKEIATELNLPIGTIGGKIQTGIKMIKILIKKEGLLLSDF
jgi:RNA polymerase sigma-70 factor, ECF subfamily